MSRKKKPVQMNDRMLYEIAVLFMGGMKAPAIAKEMNKRHKLKLTREQVYPKIGEAVQHRLLALCPSRDLEMKAQLDGFPNRGDIEVVNACGPLASSGVSFVAAEKVLELIKKIGKERDGGPVHLAIGIGQSTREFARRLGALVRHDLDAPPLYIHALTSSYSWNPLETPLACFTYFTETLNDTIDLNERFIGVFSDPFYPAENYEEEKVRNPLLKFAFDRKAEIDIVVTSIGSLGTKCEHGYLQQYLQRFGNQNPADIEELKAQGWRGDVQLRPYTERGPISITRGPKPVTLFETEELVELARSPGKHVLLMCGPCGHATCGATKADALQWLLLEPTLWFWNHLVVDWGTAREVVALAKRVGPARVRRLSPDGRPR